MALPSIKGVRSTSARKRIQEGDRSSEASVDRGDTPPESPAEGVVVDLGDDRVEAEGLDALTYHGKLKRSAPPLEEEPSGD